MHNKRTLEYFENFNEIAKTIPFTINFEIFETIPKKELFYFIINHLKQKGCKICKSTNNLSFHHRDLEDKWLDISTCVRRINSTSTIKFVKEIAKCDLVCRKCHDELHSKEMEFKYISKFIPNISIQESRLIFRICGGLSRKNRVKFFQLFVNPTPELVDYFKEKHVAKTIQNFSHPFVQEVRLLLKEGKND